MKIVGHRGASADAPENTLEALQLAWAQGADAAECDIARTRDGQLVLLHDDSTKRTSAKGVDLPVAESDWSALQTVDVGRWKGERWQGVKIPLLAEVLRAIPAGKELFVEIKSGESNRGADARVLDELAALLEQEQIAPAQVIFICFDHAFLNRLKERLPQYRAFYLTSYLPARGRWPDARNLKQLDEHIAAARAHGIDGLDLESAPVVTREWVERIHAAGLKVAIWSYTRDDTLEAARRYRQLGVDYYTTNTPGMVLAELAPPTAPSEDECLRDGRLTAVGIAYLSRFKHFSLFERRSTLLLFLLSLPLTLPLALLRVLLLVATFAGGTLLKRLFGFHIEAHPRLVSLVYFLGLGVYTRAKHEAPVAEDSARRTVIVTNHHSRFDAMLLANLHRADATYRAAARTSLFGRLLIASGLASRTMEEGLALDTREGREEFRRRLQDGAGRPLLFFPEGRVVQKPQTIMTFQNHLLLGQKVRVVCRQSRYTSYFLDHTQIELPFFKPPFSALPGKLIWDSLIEILPFLVSLLTLFETEVIARVDLRGDENQEEIDAALYAPYLARGFTLVEVDPQLAKKLLQALYR
jgi:glycerophosphoryl diester phosphodiesterase